MTDRAHALAELAESTVKVVASCAQAWQQARSQLSDPVALDRFALQLMTMSSALGMLAERSQQLAESILDGED